MIKTEHKVKKKENYLNHFISKGIEKTKEGTSHNVTHRLYKIPESR